MHGIITSQLLAMESLRRRESMLCDMKACTHTHTHTHTHTRHVHTHTHTHTHPFPKTDTDSQGKYNLNQCFQTVINEPILKCP